MSLYIFSLFLIGLVLLVATVGSGWIARLPVSYALIYLLAGVLLGPHGINFIDNRPSGEFIERLTELVVIVSVFGCGLKVQRPLTLAAWQVPARLLGLLMPISIVAIATLAHWLLDFSWGAAVLLGAILAPTDPVLASDVQMAHSRDPDHLKFALTSEGGLNDSLAFPFVYFGLKLIEDPQLGWLRQWLLIDVIWAIAAGIGAGIAVAWGISWLDRRIQRSQPADELMDDLTALSVILLTYSITELINGYGFLAVFAAGLTLGRRYRIDRKRHHSQREFVEQVEKLLEVVTIVLLGSLLRLDAIATHWQAALIAGVALLLVIRPLGTQLSLIGSALPARTRWLAGWFGIRGIGSLYYLTYAMGRGLSPELVEPVAWITYMVVTLSIILHGVTVSPLIRKHERRAST